MSILLFQKAMAIKLRADATLVSLTSYSVSNISIAKYEPPYKLIKPALFFVDTGTSDLLNADTNEVNDTDVNFYAYGRTDTECVQIADRLRAMFRNTDVRLAFLNISNTDIYCLFSKILDRGRVMKDEKLDYYECRIGANFVWANK